MDMFNFGMEQRGAIKFGGGLNKADAIREAEGQGYFVVVPFGASHAELFLPIETN